MFKYRTLDAWKHAHAAVLDVLRTTDRPHHPRTRNLFDQLRRAAISVEANVVEGYALATVPLYHRHLRIAMGSAAEAECLLRIAGELAYLERADVERIEGLMGDAMGTLKGLLRARSAPASG